LLEGNGTKTGAAGLLVELDIAFDGGVMERILR
jgi:hypothetical protein